jgi:iron complex outermembrane receptor protein
MATSFDGLERSMLRALFGVVLATVIVLSAAAVAAQTPATGVSGVVKDQTGAVLPGATLRIVSEATGTAVETITDAQGAYRSSTLAPGAYRLETSLDGFETDTRGVVIEPGQTASVEVSLATARFSQSVVVTARRVEELAQEVPIPVSVVRGDIVADAGAFNVNRLKELIPTVQFYSSNPRNSSVQIRGLGAPFGLTNDGLDSGVGLYVDGVYYARPASATLDFLDVDQVEVLRGPQGTLFGKNASAGAINVTTRKPSFTPGTEFELNYGNIGFVQAKASITGPLSKTVAFRASLSGTQRNGVLLNTRTEDDVNNLNNLGFRGQVLFAPSDRLAIAVTGDQTRQRPKGFTQVVAGVAPTLRPANRQWPQIAADLGYTAPSYNAFDRVTDVDSPMRSYQDLGGVSVNADWKVGRGQLTSTTAWRYWDWNPSNDRDFTGLPITTISAGTSKQHQWTQEVRYAATINPRLNFVAGAFYFNQLIESNPVIKQEQGSAAARMLLAPSANAATPGLLDGYGFNQIIRLDNVSAAGFGQVEWSVTDRLRLLPGLRLNYDKKDGSFDQQVYGGLQTTNPALIALQRSVLAPLTYAANIDDTNVSGQITAAFKVTPTVHTYATYSTGFKSIGFNLNGIPVDDAGAPILSTVSVKPEDTHHVEAGIKTEIGRNLTVNVTAYNTEIKDFQATVFNGNVGVARGYIANAEKARVRGIELDASARLNGHITVYGAAAFTDAIYVSFPDAPSPFEETGGPTSKDISGSILPGVSRWSGSFGGEFSRPGTFIGRAGQFFAATDVSARSWFSSNATPSKYLNIDGYALVNPRVGFRFNSGLTLSVWSRNLLNKDYMELMSTPSGNTGLFVGQPGDPRTFGVTLRLSFKS